MSLLRTLLAGTTLLAAAGSFAAASVGVAYVARIATTLPSHVSVDDWKPREGTTVLAADGTVLGLHAREFRKFVSLAGMPRLVIDAFVSAEDGNYWHHHGIDPKGVVRAALSNLRSGGGHVEGGSTITQQLAKNLFLSPERTIDRKVREAILALKIDRDVGKERVLEIYLNQIYFGSGAYGVAAAAETYFGKTLAQLSPAEAATLAGLPQAPSAANPYSRPAKALERRNYVLKRMADDGRLASLAAAAAMAEPLVTVGRPQQPGPVSDPAYRYPEEHVRRLLVQKHGSDRIYGEGGSVRTFLDAGLQKIVHEELRRGLVREDRHAGWRGPLLRGVALPANWADERLASPAGAEDWAVGVVSDAGEDATVQTARGEVILHGRDMEWATSSRRASRILHAGDAVLVADLGSGPELVQVPEVQGAVVVMDPSSGAVVAMDGGFSSETSEFNRATQARRQTGSVFKTFVFMAAMERGFDAMSPVLDSPIALDQGPGLEDWRPRNGEKGMGLITLRRAAELSRNMATVRLLYDLGEASVASVASRAGFDLPGSLNYSLALGAAETTPLNVATAYSAIANGGYRVSPRFYEEQGAPAPVPMKVFDPVAVAQTSSVLEGVVHNGTASKAFDGFERPLAAKTGTTNESRDAWFVAYGPRFVAVSWVGRDDHKPLSRAASGGGTVAPVMRAILDRAAEGGELRFDPFTLPDGARTVLADRQSGLQTEDGDVVEIVRGDAQETGADGH